MSRAGTWREGLDAEKLAATVLYLLRRCEPYHPGVVSLVKMVWFSDYLHYREHLRSITGGRYVTLKEGPVLDDYKALFARMEENGYLAKREVPIQGKEYPKIEYSPLMEPDEGMFSDSELEVLTSVVMACRNRSGRELSELTHREGPWPLVWDDERPGAHIPYTLFRWLDNLPDEDDFEIAREALSRLHVAAELEEILSDDGP